MTTRGNGNLVSVPGSKSIANRALICAALARSESVISNCAPGDDTEAMIDALKILGVGIERNADKVRVSGTLNLEATHELQLNAKLAGTTSRFLTALCSLRAGTTTIDGDATLRMRPMLDLHNALGDLGARVSPVNNDGYLPVRVCRGDQWQAKVAVSATMSSQFTSGLMMIAPRLPSGLEIVLSQEVVSRGYIEMTVGVMRAFGVNTDFSGNQIWVSPGEYQGTNFTVEPDASSASYPLGAVAISGGSVTIEGLSRNSLQGDVEFVDLLARMGCDVSESHEGLKLSRQKERPLRGIEVDMSQISDCVPTLAVVAMFAETPTQISGVGFIRTKESDRIGDLIGELRKLGANISETHDGMVIAPASLHGASLETHHDHRLAMAFALIQREVDGVVINNPEVVSKSWPNYFDTLRSFYKS
ncbi:MAG: 3-phosphoshikimate 1-carboxyvinyltransferase [Ilumatobacteraceae bacterium]|nr:3-phosphoshikimate 1-carboxyvinyltransferase [Ilumatobacteraceae bacterium]